MVISMWHLQFVYVAEILAQVLVLSSLNAAIFSVMRNATYQTKNHRFDHAGVDLLSISTDSF